MLTISKDCTRDTGIHTFSFALSSADVSKDPAKGWLLGVGVRSESLLLWTKRGSSLEEIASGNAHRTYKCAVDDHDRAGRASWGQCQFHAVAVVARRHRWEYWYHWPNLEQVSIDIVRSPKPSLLVLQLSAIRVSCTQAAVHRSTRWGGLRVYLPLGHVVPRVRDTIYMRSALLIGYLNGMGYKEEAAPSSPGQRALGRFKLELRGLYVIIDSFFLPGRQPRS